MRVIYRKIRQARYLYIKRIAGKVWGARYTLGARYLSKNIVRARDGEISTSGLCCVIINLCAECCGMLWLEAHNALIYSATIINSAVNQG